MKKPTMISVLTGVGLLACTGVSFAEESGFVSTEKGIRYQNVDGSYAVNSWVQDAQENWYHFDENGYMQTAWFQDTDGTYYWLDETGKMVHDITCTIQGKNYAFNSEGALCGAWQQDEKGWWYLEGDKVSYPVNTWKQIEEEWYHFDENGYMQTAWFQDTDGAYYWLDETGKRIHDLTCTIQGRNYTFASDGTLCGSWQEDENGKWYLEKDKVSYPKNTWKQIDGAWYHFDGNGYVQTGWYTENVDAKAHLYFLKDSGEMACGEVLNLDEEYFYTFDENGILTGKEPVKSEKERELERLASQIVAQLVSENMTKREKATAIYQWIQSHIGYISTSDKSDWVAEGIRGLKTRRGDCFTYYAVSRAMLDAAGIENLPVYPKEGYHVHYWNLIHVEGGWYHFDTTPRVSGAKFCIVTNAQYDALSNARYSTKYLENGFTYPEMATK